MKKKIALKKLKSSDLSFFKSYLQKNPSAKQKGFNLDLNVMEGEFFPYLRELLEPRPKKAVHVDLTIFGPGAAGPHSLARKIKRDAKNIRLNGEIVDAPVTDPERYGKLTPGDFALLEFTGTPLPASVKVVLVAAACPDDHTVHQVLSTILPAISDSMKVLSVDDLDKVVQTADPVASHPIRDWLDAQLFEEVGYGDANAAVMLNKRRLGRGISPADFKTAKESAERTGFLGEELLDVFLRSRDLPDVSSHVWVSQENAISPYDFMINGCSGDRHADAKSTSGKFSNPIYLSSAELKHAVESGVPYDIYRLYEVREAGALLRVAHDVGLKLGPVLKALDAFPPGVAVDSISFVPDFFEFTDLVHRIDADAIIPDEMSSPG